jgi:hypothetical protein
MIEVIHNRYLGIYIHDLTFVDYFPRVLFGAPQCPALSLNLGPLCILIRLPEFHPDVGTN